MSEILWRRLRYMLSPQWDIYDSISGGLAGNEVVLDVGCGTGVGALRLRRRCKTVMGMDKDDEAINFCFKVMTVPGVSWVTDDVSKESYNSSLYDVITMVEVLEHIVDYGLALRNVATLLQPGGKLYITARNANANLRRNDLHLREWTAQEFVHALEAHFETVELYDYSLTEKQDIFTHVTPLVAVCQK